MLKVLRKILPAFLILLIIIGFCGFMRLQSVSAQSIWDSITDKSEGGLKEIGDTVFGGETPKNTVPEIIASIIKYLFTFLGIIFVTLIIYGGFLYMTARGDSESIKNAKNIIINASIGLAIILASYSFTYFVLESLTKATGTN